MLTVRFEERHLVDTELWTIPTRAGSSTSGVPWVTTAP
jgi:hypothetical protein